MAAVSGASLTCHVLSHFLFFAQPYIDALFECWNLGHQTTEYYRHGEVDSCAKQYARVKTCFAVKVSKPAEAHALATALLREEREERERPLTHRPTVGTVWRLRKDPGADWPYDADTAAAAASSSGPGGGSGGGGGTAEGEK